MGNGIKSVGYDAFEGCTDLSEVYYEGTEEEFKNIVIESGNEILTSAKIYYFSLEPNENGWYYYDGLTHSKVPSPRNYEV